MFYRNSEIEFRIYFEYLNMKIFFFKLYIITFENMAFFLFALFLYFLLKFGPFLESIEETEKRNRNLVR